MKKFLKVLLKVFLGLLMLIIIIVIAAAIYLNRGFINIDRKDKYAGVPIQEITINGYTFRDLNRNGKLDVYEDTRESMDARVKDLLSQMSLDEKIRLLKGSGMKSAVGFGSSKDEVRGAAGTTSAIPRLGIPTIYLADGPAGLRIFPSRKHDTTTYYCTAFPIGTLVASTWDVDLVKKVGEAMGNEALEYGVDVILGPGVNIQRNPLNGRNFEYYSEDPVVTGDIGAAMVKGIQSNGVGTSVKHFVANSQETNRNNNDAIISDRALREIYLKGFEIVIKKSQPFTIMSSYNLVNGTHTSESKFLLADVLRNNWGFRGVVMTDWFGGTNPPKEIEAGNDLLMPGTRAQYKSLKKAAESGLLPVADIDTSVSRVLRLILNSRRMQQYKYSDHPDLKAHALVARQSASEGMVLLKNNKTLPLHGVKNVALFGITSFRFIAGGTGSGSVNKAYTVSLEEGLSNAGFEIYASTKKAFEEFKAEHKKAFKKGEGMLAMLKSTLPPEMIPSEALLTECKNSADIAIITIGRNSGEGSDRLKKDDFDLSDKEHELIQSVCNSFHEAGKKVVVVLNIGGVIETASWKDLPDAILLAWQGGQEGGNAVADILSGKVNPCGKLTMTFPVALEDHASTANFPLDKQPMSMNAIFVGHKPKPKDQLIRNVDYTKYEEGIYVGYRHFDKQNINVSYPFGYGLSYSKFEYENMNITVVNDTIHVSLSVKNEGQVPGKEVVEIYISKPDSKIDRPVQELKAFAKTPLLDAGEVIKVNLIVPVSDLSYWDEKNSNWTLEKGTYVINASASSRDKRLSKEIRLEE